MKARGGGSAAGDVRAALWRAARRSFTRVALVWVVLGSIYAFAPLGQHLDGSVVVQLIASLSVLAGVTIWEFRSVTQSRFPEVKAFEAVGVALPLVLLPYSTAYYVMAVEVPASFGTHLSRLDALYFTITTFSTVGFGDIAAKTEAARAVVTSQMVIDLILIGFIARALLGAARRRRDTLTSTEDSARRSLDDAPR